MYKYSIEKQMPTKGEKQMSETLDKEFEAHLSEEEISEEAATGYAAVKKGAKSGESQDRSGAKYTEIGGTKNDSEEGAAGTKNLGSAASGAVAPEKDKSLKTKPSDASSAMPGALSSKIFDEVEADDKEETITEAEFDFTEDVDALVAGEELSEEFKDRAKTIFEAAVTSKVKTEVASLKEAFESELEKQVAELKEELAKQVDDYLTYAASTWMSENELAIEHGVKTEIAESFMSGLKGLFTEHHIGVPEDKFNMLDGMTEQLDEMELKLNEQIDTNVQLNKQLGGYMKMGIVSEVAAGLAETQKEKLSSLAEGVEFESEEDFRKKVETIKESYFTRRESVTTTDAATEDAEPLVEEAPATNAAMSSYVAALARWSK
jgi:F0F1-type ATP synthase membrane subunit b/b'